jgi:hypothetical protein
MRDPSPHSAARRVPNPAAAARFRTLGGADCVGRRAWQEERHMRRVIALLIAFSATWAIAALEHLQSPATDAEVRSVLGEIDRSTSGHDSSTK